MALDLGLQRVCFVGTEFAKALATFEDLPADKVISFDTSAELADWFTANPCQESIILIKGSRGTRMEKVIAVL
jgi:UDP-N-acetylmuramyl pentapeptide synthase